MLFGSPSFPTPPLLPTPSIPVPDGSYQGRSKKTPLTTSPTPPLNAQWSSRIKVCKCVTDRCVFSHEIDSRAEQTRPADATSPDLSLRGLDAFGSSKRPAVLDHRHTRPVAHPREARVLWDGHAGKLGDNPSTAPCLSCAAAHPLQQPLEATPSINTSGRRPSGGMGWRCCSTRPDPLQISSAAEGLKLLPWKVSLAFSSSLRFDY